MRFPADSLVLGIADDRAVLGGYVIYAVFFGGYADRTWSRMDDDYFSTFRMGLLLFYFSTLLIWPALFYFMFSNIRRSP